jgi:hypothetical protein
VCVCVCVCVSVCVCVCVCVYVCWLHSPQIHRVCMPVFIYMYVFLCSAVAQLRSSDFSSYQYLLDHTGFLGQTIESILEEWSVLNGNILVACCVVAVFNCMG